MILAVENTPTMTLSGVCRNDLPPEAVPGIMLVLPRVRRQA